MRKIFFALFILLSILCFSQEKRNCGTKERLELYRQSHPESIKESQILEQHIQKWIDKNASALYFAIASHVSLGNAKNFLISKLSQIQSIGHFIRTSNGFKVTNPEGYVAVDRSAGAVKLVDRLEFSRANFTIAKDWVKG